jgi:hypothetical protein
MALLEIRVYASKPRLLLLSGALAVGVRYRRAEALLILRRPHKQAHQPAIETRVASCAGKSSSVCATFKASELMRTGKYY